MSKFRSSVLIHRPVQEVFKFVAQDYFENRPKWSTDGLNFQLPDGQKVRQETSIRRVDTYRSGRQVDTTLRITEYEPDKKITIRTTSVFVSSKSPTNRERGVSTETERTMLFEPTQSGTRLVFVSATWVEGANTYQQIYGTLSWLLWSRSRKVPVWKALDRIADLLEGPSRERAIRSRVRRLWSWWYAYFLVAAALFWVNLARYDLRLSDSAASIVRDLLSVMVGLAIVFFLFRRAMMAGRRTRR